MNRVLVILFCVYTIVVNTSCKNNSTKFDASGTFEAEETIVSAESSGVLKEFKIEEGDRLKAGEYIGYIDSIQLYLKKMQLEAQINSLYSRKPNIPIQLAALQEQLNAAETEQKRFNNLVKEKAATTKQLDDINTQVDVINKQIDALRSTLQISGKGIDNDASSLKLQVDQLSDQLSRCKINNPIDGTVLTKFSMANEIVSTGKALYKIADLSTIILRVYITGNQLSQVKLGQKVNINTDNGKGGFEKTDGIISWINDKAEFTPKTIQTKSERANLVYAVKIKVVNNGQYKIGMYGEIFFE